MSQHPQEFPRIRKYAKTVAESIPGNIQIAHTAMLRTTPSNAAIGRRPVPTRSKGQE
jgi:hypothetical protein